MKCIILAAGYATRLYPLTQNFPKPLLTVCGKTIMDILIDDVKRSGVIDEYIVISNSRFYGHFIEWSKKRSERITVLDDGTSSNETRLGAVRDIEFAINKLNLRDDALVMAGDNLLNFSLCTFIDYATSHGESCVMRYFEPEKARLSKSGVLVLSDCDRVVKMQEKPAEPLSNWCCPPFYYFTRGAINRVSEALIDGCGADAPGSFIEWLCLRETVYAMEMPGRRYDIGNLESYEKVQREYVPLF